MARKPKSASDAKFATRIEDDLPTPAGTPGSTAKGSHSRGSTFGDER